MAYNKKEQYDVVVKKKLQKKYSDILSLIGENPAREGLLKTPERVAKAMQFFTQGYGQNATEIIEKALFLAESQDMVVVKNIQFYSLCEHHMVPFFGKVHIAYFPDKHIVGLSKLPRIVDMFARRLQVQERMNKEIVDAIQQSLKPKGIAVVIEAQHLCMMMRGVQKCEASTTTSSFTGVFENEKTKQDFFQLI